MLSYDDLFALINYSSYVTSAFMAISIAALLYLRITQPNLERPIKVSISLVVTALPGYYGDWLRTKTNLQ